MKGDFIRPIHIMNEISHTDRLLQLNKSIQEQKMANEDIAQIAAEIKSIKAYSDKLTEEYYAFNSGIITEVEFIARIGMINVAFQNRVIERHG